MAGNSLIGALRVSLGLDSAQFETGMKRSKNSMSDMAKTAQKVGLAVAAAVTGAAAGMSALVSRVTHSAAATADVAERLGVGVEALQELRHAAEMGGMGVQNFDLALRRFIRRASEADKGTGAAKTAFQELGVQLRDNEGRLKSSEALLAEVADAMGKVPSQADRLRLAFKLFDSDGAAMVNVLANGSAGLQEMAEQARKLGIVLDERTVAASARFQDNLELVQLAVVGLGNKIVQAVLPAFERLSARLMDAVLNGQLFENIQRAVTVASTVLARAIEFVVDHMDDLLRILRVFIGVKIVMFVSSAAGAFISFAKAIRVAGLATTLFTSITRAKITALALLAAVIAQATGQLENFEAWVKRTGEAIYAALPEDLRKGVDGLRDSLEEFMGDIEGTDSTIAKSFSAYFSGANDAAGSFAEFGKTAKGSVESVGTAIDDLRTNSVEPLADTMREVSSSVSSALSGVVKSVINGEDAVGGLIGKVDQLRDRLLDMAFDQIIQGLFSNIMGAIGGGGVGLGVGAIGRGVYGGGGGFFPAFPSFAGGGFTGMGSRSGGLDGRGGFPAILHPNETVVDHTRGQGGPTFNFTIHGSRNDAAEIARSIRAEVPGMIEAYNRNPYRRAS